LKHAKNINTAVCQPTPVPKFDDKCNVENYDFGQGSYSCRYHGYPKNHLSYNENVHYSDHSQTYTSPYPSVNIHSGYNGYQAPKPVYQKPTYSGYQQAPVYTGTSQYPQG
jgi:hypothetical protein